MAEDNDIVKYLNSLKHQGYNSTQLRTEAYSLMKKYKNKEDRKIRGVLSEYILCTGLTDFLEPKEGLNTPKGVIFNGLLLPKLTNGSAVDYDDETFENDAVFVLQNGIFVFEVKNWFGDVKINANGKVERSCGETQNVFGQNNMHCDRLLNYVHKFIKKNGQSITERDIDDFIKPIVIICSTQGELKDLRTKEQKTKRPILRIDENKPEKTFKILHRYMLDCLNNCGSKGLNLELSSAVKMLCNYDVGVNEEFVKKHIEKLENKFNKGVKN